MVVTALDDSLKIEVFNEELNAEIEDIAVFLCLAFRMPRNGSAHIISTGSFVGHTFTMTTETPLNDHPACWVKLFRNAVVVVKPSEIFPEDGLLKLSFGALLQLSPVEYPIMVGSGLVLEGYSTGLVPIEINEDGQIL